MTPGDFRSLKINQVLTAQIEREHIFSREASCGIACGVAVETDCPQIRNHGR